MKMFKKFSQPLKNYTCFHEIYTTTIWTVYDRKRNARILGGINDTHFRDAIKLKVEEQIAERLLIFLPFKRR